MEKIIASDWGSITPEFYNKEKKSVIHVFNHCLVGEENVSRAIRFAIGRIEWFKKYLSLDCNHEVAFDDRGQDIDDAIRNRIIKSLSNQASKVSFASKRR